METFQSIVDRLVSEELLIQVTCSQLRKGVNANGVTRVTVKPVRLKAGLCYQFSTYQGPKVLHENVAPVDVAQKVAMLMEQWFRQALVQATEADYQVLTNRKGEQTVLRKAPTKQPLSVAAQAHNRRKQYVLEEGKPIPFLVALGIMNEEGKVLARKYDKFRQINRFVELVADVLPHLQAKGRPLQIVDFGCGKSYLTFALSYLLHDLEGLDIRVVGLDLKADVIADCAALAQRLGLDHLHFQTGDISTYEGLSEVDLVVTLHACDTATDAALDKAIRWGAQAILSVPCCQHELFGHIQSTVLKPLLQHGLLKERFSALATDALRAKLLELAGYRTQVVEFIDLEHTPKNLLIRAIRTKRPVERERDKLWTEYEQMRDALGAQLWLERALSDLLE